MPTKKKKKTKAKKKVAKKVTKKTKAKKKVTKKTKAKKNKIIKKSSSELIIKTKTIITPKIIKLDLFALLSLIIRLMAHIIK